MGDVVNPSGGFNWQQAGADMLGNLLMAGFGGGDGQQYPTNLYLTSPGGRELLDQMLQQTLRDPGGGDFGFGASVRRGSATLENMLAQRGIDRGSGVAANAISEMIANASAQDASARRNYMLNLAQAGPATALANRLSEEWGGVAAPWGPWPGGYKPQGGGNKPGIGPSNWPTTVAGGATNAAAGGNWLERILRSTQFA